MNKIKNGLTALVIALGLVGAPLALSVAGSTGTYAAVNPKEQICRGSGGIPGAGGSCGDTSGQGNLTDVVKKIVNVLLYIIGIVAVIVIIIAGFRYVTSSGDSSKVAAAKNTILYAIIGLVVAIFAYAIVNFVVGSF